MAQTGNFVLDKGYDASEALEKYVAVKLDDSVAQTVKNVGSSDDAVIGVTQFGVTSDEIDKGKGASVRLAGITVMEASEAIDPGDAVGFDTDGKAKVADPGDRIIGVCTEGAADDGLRCSVFLALPGQIASVPGTTGARGHTGPTGARGHTGPTGT